MTEKFDFYEYAGVIVPGAVLLLGIALLDPLAWALVEKGVSFGEFGLFLVAAYATGQLVQSVGTLLESPVWRFAGGVPNGRILTGEGLTQMQHARLRERLAAEGLLGVEEAAPDEAASRSVTREVYARVRRAGESKRVDTFNGVIGLSRGLASAFLLLAAFVVIDGIEWDTSGAELEIEAERHWTDRFGAVDLRALVLLLVAVMLSIRRWVRFSRYYGRDLFMTYLAMESSVGESQTA